jgi:hypothetical protein
VNGGGETAFVSFSRGCRRRMISRSEDVFLEFNLWIRSYKNEKEKSPPSADEDLNSILSMGAN